MGEARQSHHRRWTRLMRLPAALGMGLVLAGAGDPARTTATVSTATQQTLRGWGMSLAWEANVIHGGPFGAARIPDPAEQRRTMDVLWRSGARGQWVRGFFQLGPLVDDRERLRVRRRAGRRGQPAR